MFHCQRFLHPKLSSWCFTFIRHRHMLFNVSLFHTSKLIKLSRLTIDKLFFNIFFIWVSFNLSEFLIQTPKRKNTITGTIIFTRRSKTLLLIVLEVHCFHSLSNVLNFFPFLQFLFKKF